MSDQSWRFRGGLTPDPRDARILALETALGEACDMIDECCEVYAYASTDSRRKCIAELRRVQKP